MPDDSKTIREGAIAPWSTPGYRGYLQELLDAEPRIDIPVDVPFRQLAPESLRRLVEGVPETGFTGLKGFARALERQAYKPHVRVFLSRWRRSQRCPACHGARLRPEALAVRLAGRNIAELSAMTIRETRAFLSGLDAMRRQPVAAGLLVQVENRLDYLAEIGLDYLTLDRAARSLSGGSSSGSS